MMRYKTSITQYDFTEHAVSGLVKFTVKIMTERFKRMCVLINWVEFSMVKTWAIFCCFLVNFAVFLAGSTENASKMTIWQLLVVYMMDISLK